MHHAIKQYANSEASNEYRDIYILKPVEMKHEINVWKRAAARVNIASREESIMKALFMQKATEKENAVIRLMYNMR